MHDSGLADVISSKCPRKAYSAVLLLLATALPAWPQVRLEVTSIRPVWKFDVASLKRCRGLQLQISPRKD